MAEEHTPHPHIAVFQSPGMGHLIPIVEFAKKIISLYNVSSTIIIPSDCPISSSQLLFLDNLPNGIDYILLPQVSLFDVRPEDRMDLTISGSIPSLRNAIESLLVNSKSKKRRLVALVLDFFTTDYGIDVAREFNVSPYVFWSSNALSFAFMNYLPKLDQSVKCEFRELSDPIRVPGCVPLYGKDLLDPVQDRKNDVYKGMVRNSKRLKFADGIVFNTFEDLEGETLKALAQEEGIPPLYPIGPLVQQTHSSINSDHDASGCLRWLDDQPRSSVVFVSFGSGGTLSNEQFTELAFGLEESGHRFIWVIRSPSDNAASAYFGDTNNDDPLAYLPQGFLERTKGRGLIVSSWAPQAAILGHVATGGFITHCGWNSILESMVNGVPLIVWPLYAEQKMNAVLMTDDDLKVALRPETDENGLVKRDEAANVVKKLMEGDKGKVIRNKMRYFQKASVKTLRENGSSTKSLAQLTCQWKNKAA